MKHGSSIASACSTFFFSAVFLAVLSAEARAASAGAPQFQVRNYAGKCLDYGPAWLGTGATVFLNDCAVAHSIVVEEINSRHEVILHAGTRVIGIHNPPVSAGDSAAIAVTTGYALELQIYNPILASTANQVFALDGDSIILASSRPCANTDPNNPCPAPPPQLVIQIQNARGANGSPLFAGVRKLEEPEFWDFIAADGSGAYPTGAFVPVGTNYDLWNALCTPSVVTGDPNGMPTIYDPGQPDNGFLLNLSTPCMPKAGWGTVVVIAQDDPNECTSLPVVGPCLDLSNYPPLSLGPGVTIHGDRRGSSFGPQLYDSFDAAKESASLPCQECMIEINGDYTRVTGLRLRGQTRSTTSGPYTTAIEVHFPGPVTGPPPFSITTLTQFITTIDHNDISDWGEAAVKVTTPYSFEDNQTCTFLGDLNSSGQRIYYPCAYTVPDPATGKPEPIANDPATLGNVFIFNNFLHHNESGYAIVLGRATVAGNAFVMNRHAIAASGEPHNEYNASYNLVLSAAPEYTGTCILGICHHYYNQDFDMHGTQDPGHWYNGFAGYHVGIFSNMFLGTNRPNFELRGFPELNADFDNNVSLESQGDAVDFRLCYQICVGGAYIVPIAIVSDQFNSSDPTGQLAVGDFDGDGTQDLFLATGAAWYYAAAGAREWQFLSAKTDAIGQLLFGDFDGDGRTDVVAMHGGELVVSWGGISDWEVLDANPCPPAVASCLITDMAVGKFLDHPAGDQRDDLFLADGATWYLSFAGSNPFSAVNTSSSRRKDLLFADFDGDGKTDVFGVVSNGSFDTWSYSSRAVGVWAEGYLRPALTSTVDGLVAADFNGDGIADIGTSCGSGCWQISYSGKQGWAANNNLDSLGTVSGGIGRFSGGKGADVLLWNGTDIWVSAGGAATPQALSSQEMR